MMSPMSFFLNPLRLRLLLLFFAPLLVLPSCQKDENPEPQEPEIEYYFYGTIGEEEISFEVTQTGIMELGNGLASSNNPPEECDVDYSSYIGNIDGFPFFEVEFVNYYIGPCSEAAEGFHALFIPAFYPFFLESELEGFGAQVKYGSPDGVVYRSSRGDQTASDFELTASFDADNLYGKYQRIKGVVNCTLYAENGDSLVLKNGLFSLSLVSFF